MGVFVVFRPISHPTARARAQKNMLLIKSSWYLKASISQSVSGLLRGGVGGGGGGGWGNNEECCCDGSEMQTYPGMCCWLSVSMWQWCNRRETISELMLHVAKSLLVLWRKSAKGHIAVCVVIFRCK